MNDALPADPAADEEDIDEWPKVSGAAISVTHALNGGMIAGDDDVTAAEVVVFTTKLMEREVQLTACTVTHGTYAAVSDVVAFRRHEHNWNSKSSAAVRVSQTPLM